MPSLYFNPVGSYLVVTLAAGVMFLLLVLVPVFSKGPPGRRTVLAGLRVAIFLLVVAAMLRPTLVFSSIKKQATAVLLLADGSRSMQVADAFGGKTRWEALRDTLDQAAPALEAIAKDFELKAYTFGEEAQPVEQAGGKLALDSQASGRQTAIGAALQQVLREQGGKRLAAVLLLTDGAQRAVAPRDLPPQIPARQLASIGSPLYGFVFGEARGRGQARDVALTDLLVPETVFVKNQLDVLSTARIDGYVNQEIRASLLWESGPGRMGEVERASVRADQNGQRIPIEMNYIPEVPGEYKVTLRVPAQPGELVTTNNEISTFVTVQPGGLRVLYLEGAPRFEQTHLRRALDASRDIQLDFRWIDHRNREGWPVDLSDAFQPGKYDVYVLGDLDSSAFRPEDLSALAERVAAGSGLLMLGGAHSFGPGGYQGTPLAGVLPVEMGPHERQSFDEPVRDDLHWPGPLKMQPAEPLGTRHFIMHLAPSGANEQTWLELPALSGANRLEPRRTGKVLARAGDRPNAPPLLIVDDSGLGRAAAFAADTTWLWPMHGFEKQHKRFWRQMILWLAKKDQVTDGSVWVRLAQRRHAPGGRVDFTVGATTNTGEPVEGATFEAEVVTPAGTRHSLALVQQGEEVSGSFVETELAGDYTLHVRARKADDTLGEAQARFLIYEQDLELENAAADRSLIDSLAQITAEAGGESLPPESLTEVLEKLQEKRSEFDVRVQRRLPLWDTWPFFLLLVGVMTTEWYLRRKWGLV